MFPLRGFNKEMFRDCSVDDREPMKVSGQGKMVLGSFFRKMPQVTMWKIDWRGKDTLQSDHFQSFLNAWRS